MTIPNSKYLILSIIGSHAGEGLGQIFSRKQHEIKENAKTYWLLKSFKAKTAQVQNMCQAAEKEGKKVYCLFINSSAKNGVRATTHNSVVQHISEDGNTWSLVPDGSKITGKLDMQSTALVLDELAVISPQKIDLWNYSEFGTKLPIKLQLGASTICCENTPSHGMRSRFRDVVAVGRLTAPFAVWVK